MFATIVACSGGTTDSPEPSSSISRSSAGDGVLVAATAAELPPNLRAYPFATPTPAPERSELDGTYMLILGLEELGGPRFALPFPCLRCLPFARDPGVSTLILFEGMYFVHHQMSGFRARGNFEIRGDRLVLFNDAYCPAVRGTYLWRTVGPSLELEVVDDTCAFEGERAIDLGSNTWTKVPACKREILNLWPGILGC